MDNLDMWDKASLSAALATIYAWTRLGHHLDKLTVRTERTVAPLVEQRWLCQVLLEARHDARVVGGRYTASNPTRNRGPPRRLLLFLRRRRRHNTERIDQGGPQVASTAPAFVDTQGADNVSTSSAIQQGDYIRTLSPGESVTP